jgi:hypothetical protein
VAINPARVTGSSFVRVLKIMAITCTLGCGVSLWVVTAPAYDALATRHHHMREGGPATSSQLLTALGIGLGIGITFGGLLSVLVLRPSDDRKRELSQVERALEINARQAHADGRFEDERRFRREIADIERERRPRP